MSGHELIEVKADCPNCGSERFNEWSRKFSDGSGRFVIIRKCRDCGKKAAVTRVKMSDVERVVRRRRAQL